MAQAKAKLRTSDDVFKRLRFAVESDYDSEFFGVSDLWTGYEDGIYGPMEQVLSAFVPIDQGGDLPFHKVWYFRCGDRVLWDRRRRLDEIWLSGDTRAIHAIARGDTVKGFDAAGDKKAAEETQSAITQAAATMADMEEARQIRLVEQQKQRQRQLAKRQHEKEERERRALAEKPRVDANPVTVQSVGGSSSWPASCSELRVLTWNGLNDAHADDYPLETRSCYRAVGLAEAIRDKAPDIVTLQEATAEMIKAIDAQWPVGSWRTDMPGELVIWSRYPMTRAFAVDLGPDSSKYALLVEVAVQTHSVAIACIHFTSDFRGDKSLKRAGQAKIVRTALHEMMPHADVFVCGDFNEPNADGDESATQRMEGLVDAWYSVHGKDCPGFTFDPTRNHLADIGSLCKAPRRMDRIYAAPRWSVKAAVLVGADAEHSDHNGVMATYVHECALVELPVHTSAVALIPPEALWEQIDNIRQRFDMSYGRWMPHINLIYGFLPEDHFAEALIAMEPVVRKHGPFEVRLEELTLFEHANSASLVIIPSYNPDILLALQQELQALFPACIDQSSHEFGFQPHLTLGKFESDSWADDARRWKAELAKAWKPITFVVSEVCMIARTGDQPFGVRFRLPLGSSLSHKDAAMLDSLEACSDGARAFVLGSVALLGDQRSSSSDLDVLLVGTRDRESVFRDIESRLNAEWTRRVSGKFPLLQLEVDGTKLDIQYAKSTSLEHPKFWPSAKCEDGTIAAAALRDICALRFLVLEGFGLHGWQLYQHALLKLRKWTKSRRIDGNALGYFGGYTWATLLADTMLNSSDSTSMPQRFEDRSSDVEDELVIATCKRFASWPWPKPVSLGVQCVDAFPANSDLMPIFCTTEPHANSARNVTTSTQATLLLEMKLKVRGESRPLLYGCQAVIRCQVSAALAPARASRAAHWLEARLLALVRKLNHAGARPMCLAPGLYVVGSSANPAALEQAATYFRELLVQDDRHGFGFTDVIEVQVDDRDALNRCAQAARNLCKV